MDNESGFRLRRSISKHTKEEQPDKHYNYLNKSPLKAAAVQTHCTVSGALAVVLRISRLMGIAPLDLEQQGPGSWEIRVSRPAYIYSVVLMSVLNVISLSAVAIDINLEEDSVRMRTPTKSGVWLVDLFVVISTNTVIAYTAPATMGAIIDILNRIQKISSQITNNAEPAHIGKRVTFAVTFLIVLSILILLFDYYMVSCEALYKNRNRVVISLYTAYYCLYVNLTLVNLQFCLTILTMNTVLKSINGHLDRLLHVIKDKGIETIEDSVVIQRHDIPFGFTVPLKSVNIVIDKMASIKEIVTKKDSAAESIRTLGVCYMDVCRLIEKMNRSFGVITLMILFTIIIHLIITPYYLFTALFMKRNSTRTVLVQSVWCVRHLISLLLLVEPCHWTYLEYCRTRQLMAELANQTVSAVGPFVVELRKFFWCVCLNKMLFCPLGVCTMTRAMCAGIMGAVTTYLVVVMQFNTKDDESDT